MTSSSEAFSSKPIKSASDRRIQLQDIVITGRLAERAQREPNWKEQGIALGALAKVVATAPVQLVDTLLGMALQLCGAETAGLSVQETTTSGEEIFRWTHLAGKLKGHIGGSTPRHFSPCGLCTDTNAPQLFSHPEHYFTYFAETQVPFVEALVIPVRVGRNIPATIWILSHTADKEFDTEDVRIMSELADFTGCALGLLPASEPAPAEVDAGSGIGERGTSELLHAKEDGLVSLTKARASQLQRLSLKLIHAHDEERRRVARDLRERAGQYLAGLAMSLSVLLREKPPLTSTQESRLSESLRMVHHCTAEIRGISSLLHPPSLDEAGLFPAITWYLEGVTQRTGLRIDFDCPPDLRRFPHGLEVAIFRIVQDAIENIERHSGSTGAVVRIVQTGGSVRLEVRDEGCGIPPGTLSGILLGAHPDGVGIAGMRERVEMLGGTFHVRSDTGGTSIELNVPVTTELLQA